MDNNKHLEILFQSVKSKFDFVADADNALDSKSGALMGFEVAIGIGYMSLILHTLEASKFYEGIIGLLLLLSSVILLIIITYPKSYVTISVNLRERRDYLEKGSRSLILQLISDAQQSFTLNNKRLKTKTILYKIAIFLLIGSSFFIILSILNNFYV